MSLKISSENSRPFCLGLSVLDVKTYVWYLCELYVYFFQQHNRKQLRKDYFRVKLLKLMKSSTHENKFTIKLQFISLNYTIVYNQPTNSSQNVAYGQHMFFFKFRWLSCSPIAISVNVIYNVLPETLQQFEC